MKELKEGTWIAYPNKLGQSEYGRFIKKVYRMHKFKTELELEKVNGVHVYLREDSDWITVQESMAEQLEEVRRENLREANEMLLGINDVYEKETLQSNDVQQRKRNLGFENVKIPNSNKTVRWKDNGNLEVQSIYELDIPDYILQDEKPDVIGYLNKQIKCKENNDFIEEIIKNYNPIVAYYVGKSIDNLRENEIDSARDLLNKAFKHWE